MSTADLDRLRAIFAEVTDRVRELLPGIRATTEHSANDVFPLRAILRLSTGERSVLATVDFRRAEHERVVVSADVCSEGGEALAEREPTTSDQATIASLRAFFLEHVSVFLGQLS